ncbi:hypothetical protein B0T24DRAFT_685164 [Lasiosphaeria ovina]|uniref:Uncharacterized protein n=1 Tax=Lasiosphaeria ovina TaxID=92902 RepID=A0AAE0JSP5_9PEZI|nr:hypothetical protein B0T24DRAFT_685164 [Lasiosphaeria ovina]
MSAAAAAQPPPAFFSASTPAPAVKLSADDGLPASRAVLQQFARTDPKYADSFGAEAFRSDYAPGLKLIGWRVTGVVEHIWTSLEGSLGDLIKAKRERLQAQRPTQSANPPWMLRCFLVGPDTDRATPHIAVISAAKWLREGIGKVIVQSSLLRACRFRCCGLAYRAELDMMPATTSGNTGGAVPPAWSIARLNDFEVRVPVGGDINGVRIEIVLDGVVVSKATIGGVVIIDGQSLGMTVLHAFKPVAESDEDEGVEDSGIELFDDVQYASDTRDDDDDAAPEESTQTQVAEQPPGVGVDQGQQETSQNERSDLSRMVSEAGAVQSLLDQPRFDLGVLATPDARFDWALKKLQHPAQNKKFMESWAGLPPTQIVIKTSSDLKFGMLEASGVFGIPTTSWPQPVLVATMWDMVQPGDSGAWAMKVDDGEFIGMVIGSCPALHEVYLLRMGHILGDICQQLDSRAAVGLDNVDPGQRDETIAVPEIERPSHPLQLLGSHVGLFDST